MSSLPAPLGQQQLAPAPAPRRAFFGLFDAAGWGWASFRAVLWTLFIILMLGYIPDRAYYIVTSPTMELGLNAVSLVNICPGENKDLPCPAPAGARIPGVGGAPVALPRAGAGGSLLQVGTHLYYLGGRESGALDEYANTPSVAAAAIGPEGLSTWSAVAPLPAPRALSAAAYLAGTAYVIGGTSDSESATATVFTGAPDPVTGTIDAWMLADALELPAPRTGASVVTVSDGLIVFGGANEFYVPQTTVWKSTLQSNGSLGPWEEMAPLPEPRANAAAALVGDSVWIWGGRDASGYTGVSLHGYIAVEKTAGGDGHGGGAPTTDAVDEQGDAPIGSIYKWTATSGEANLPSPREGAALWSANGTLYVAGGVQDGSVVGSVHWTAPTADSGITSWKSVPQVDLPADHLRTNASAAVIGTHALLIGGEDATGAPATNAVSALTSPKAPVFKAGLFGLTIPGLAIPGEIGEQLGFLSAAGAWGLNFVLLCAMAVAYAQRERFGAWLRKRVAKK
ncbi:MAG: Kelch repeat-containing protein [Candidatus Limnocylindrus sp.]